MYSDPLHSFTYILGNFYVCMQVFRVPNDAVTKFKKCCQAGMATAAACAADPERTKPQLHPAQRPQHAHTQVNML